MSNLVLTMVSPGQLDASAMANETVTLQTLYASRCGAQHRCEVLNEPDFSLLMLEKMRVIREAMREHRRVLWLDVDVLVRPDAPDVFRLVPPTHYAAFNECALAHLAPGMHDHVRACHDDMVTVCQDDGLPIPDSRGWYFNCGVQLASRDHAFLYEPRRPGRAIWVEQSAVNVRLHLRPEVPVYHLPYAFNALQWHAPPDYARSCWFVHYCGLPYQHRVARAIADRKLWEKLYV